MSRHFLSKSARNTSAWNGIASMELRRRRHVAAILPRRATLTLRWGCQDGADLLGTGILKVGLDGDVSAELLE
jgi:hypothetical protein